MLGTNTTSTLAYLGTHTQEYTKPVTLGALNMDMVFSIYLMEEFCFQWVLINDCKEVVMF